MHDIHGPLRDDWRTVNGGSPPRPRFVAQPWHALADVYGRTGNRRRAPPATSGRPPHHTSRTAVSKPLRWAYGLLVGYGYYPLTAAIWLAIAFLLAAALTGTNKSAFAPTNPAAAAEALIGTPTTNPAVPAAGRQPASSTQQTSSSITDTADCSRLGDHYPCLDPFLYALDSALPSTVSAGQPRHGDPPQPGSPTRSQA